MISSSAAEVTCLSIPNLDPGWFTRRELAAARSSEDPDAHLVRRIAAKHAVLLCLGLPTRQAYGVQVEVDTDHAGRPCARLTGRVADHATMHGLRLLDVSLTSDGATAAALALAITDQATVQHLCVLTREDPALP